ncbi:tRNA(Met) cytidine acetyltransferase TmcA [Striga asiatica]|uniref:RNA cytidine acetyltransferase n=1 Tax=Striga asiatica TaxID=4170 RepID=A0A5A7QQD6_STRAF|nr:tRNA(Met) cytidine acetyltransferase TmcA [Striga asiatica]
MRKKVDERIRTLIENGVKARHRSMFVIIGDKSRDQVVNLNHMLRKSVVKLKPTVLWCYKDKLEISSHKKKRMKQVKKLIARGLFEPEKADSFSLFLETTDIQYCLYKDSERILGNTFGMCILQDFEALTPNLLARTIETVEGGGLILLLLRSLSSLTSLYTMVMDVHERFRTESHSQAAARFNERFLLSLASCKACIVMDDELNILPISSHIKSITAIPVQEDSEGLSEAERELKNLKEQLNDDFPVGPLIRKCCTMDQGKAVVTFLDAILDKNLRSTVALLAGRGRGKSAALGLAIAGAVAAGYSNIFVTAPSPDNLKTLFEFVCIGFNMLEYKHLTLLQLPFKLDNDTFGFLINPLVFKLNKVYSIVVGVGDCMLTRICFQEHLDYDVVKGITPENKKATVRINIYKQHRQTIQPSGAELEPSGAVELTNHESSMLDEFEHEHIFQQNLAAVPAVVTAKQRQHLDHWLRWRRINSTSSADDNGLMDDGYIEPCEHKKLSQVELLVVDEAAAIPLPLVKAMLGPYLVFLSSTVNGYEGTGRSLSLKLLQQLEEKNQISSRSTETINSGRLFKKIELSESIRYACGDPVESWLNALLCLDVTNNIPSISRLPPPSECDLYYVNRDTLFSYHKDSELFLQRMMALFVASHYKNSPSDLQLMADAPAHHLFVLLGPVDESQNHLPDILCVIQISFEGQISQKSATKSLGRGHMPAGDQIPWKVCEQFRDTVFPSLSGARIVRIATHPSAMRLGYGSAAVELLARYFEGQLSPISEVDVEDFQENSPVRVTEAAEKASLLDENIKPRTDLPPLLVPLRERRPEKLHYLGVSFGLTLDLFRFWRRHNFAPFYINHSPNQVTGEHTCMLVRPLNNDDIESSGSDPLGFFSPFYQVFRKKFTKYLARAFRDMEYKLAMSILDPKINFSELDGASSCTSGDLSSISGSLSAYGMAQLEAYTSNLVDHHMTEDFVNDLALAYFWEKIPVSLSYAQASVLLCIGLQGKDISGIEAEMKLESNQILSLYKKIMKKFYNYLSGISSEEPQPTASRLKDITMEPHPVSVDEDLNAAAKQVQDEMKSKLDGQLDPELLQQYAIVDKEADFESALQNGGRKVLSGGLISVKSSKSKVEKKHVKQSEMEKSGKKRSKHDRGSKSSKKRKA